MADHLVRTTWALITDTFREALARKIFLGLFGLSTAMIAFFLFLMKIDIVEGALATVTLFGRQAGPEMDLGRVVRQAEAGIATFLYTWGMFLAIFASAGLTPSMLEPGRIELLLSKPVGRMHLLLGRYLGNLLVVGLNITYLVGGVWMILGAKTGVWKPDFLLAIASSIFLFAILLAVVVLVGVLFESAAPAVMIPVALMLVSPILAQHKTMIRLLSSEWSRTIWKALYQVLPKVYDIGMMTISWIVDRRVESYAPIFTSAAFGAAVLAVAVYAFVKKDF